ncbi:hypothetical protein NDN08_002144 [Rhodosorus marinus]|uniref:Uncharacterized protein n=1 Tax=Rhodosorus marinus TaxID=101924 RepID=A0AAV8UVQ7_9RHOD|nr:hypothetical protein NDN08_002144 [Rhodosorus marinus]
MKLFGLFLVAVSALLASVIGAKSYEANVRVDFGTTLRTGNVENFSRRTYVNGHGSFRRDPKVVPQDMMDYLTTTLHVSFSRSTKGPFKEATFPEDTTQSAVQTNGEIDLNDQQCEDCNTYQFRFLSGQRVVTDDPYKIPEITETAQTRSRAITR